MNIDEIERVVLDQYAELAAKRKDTYCRRKEESLIDLNSALAQVVIGVRRSGKSTLCFTALERAGVKYAYINFDDDRMGEATIKDMDNILEVLYKVYGHFDYLFLDEIQNIDGWHLFANRMLRHKLHLVITGSNSKLLSGELASHLTGRHHEIELLPFSFVDYCNMQNVATGPLTTMNRGLLAGAFERYLLQGGFPELMAEKDAKSYVNTLVRNIIRQDIQNRFKVKNVDTISRLVHHLLNEAPAIISRSTLRSIFQISSTHTMGNYLSYLQQTYLISTLSKFTTKSRERVTGEKSYAIDVALMNNREDAFVGPNLGHRLETIVYLELRRRNLFNDIYYYSDRSGECDFVVCNGNRVVSAYQVSYDISNGKTRDRELKGCQIAIEKLKCKEVFLLTMNASETITTPNGAHIYIRPVWQWLVSDENACK